MPHHIDGDRGASECRLLSCTGFRNLIGEISRSSLAAIINNKPFINLVRKKMHQFGSLERG